MPAIDLSEIQNAIRAKYPRYWHNHDAQQELASHFGATVGQHVNEHGVFEAQETVEIAKAGKSWATADLAQAPNGLWIYETHEQHPYGGKGGPISIWNPTAYETRGEAITAARKEVKDSFVQIAIETSYPDNVRREARQIVEALIGPEVEQMSLFDETV